MFQTQRVRPLLGQGEILFPVGLKFPLPLVLEVYSEMIAQFRAPLKPSVPCRRETRSALVVSSIEPHDAEKLAVVRVIVLSVSA